MALLVVAMVMVMVTAKVKAVSERRRGEKWRERGGAWMVED
jgi:hypothetical protein